MADPGKLKTIDYIRHGTDILSIYKILKSGSLKSSLELGSSGTTGEDNRIIYFTPVAYKFLTYEKSTSIILDFDKTIAKYKSFFINNKNSYGPGKGNPNRRGGCLCNFTYYSPELPQDLYKPPVGEKMFCYISGENI